MGFDVAFGAGRRLSVAAALICLGLSGAPAAEPSAIAENFPGASFETTTPEAAGWSAETLAAARSWSLEVAPTAAVMIIQHGRIVAEWGDVATKSNLHSIRKSLLSALIGIAVDEHKIDPAATLQSLGIDDNAPSLTAEEKSATVADLLKARSGIYHPALYETPEMARLRPARGSHPPGTFWYYNNWDFNALGTIYEHATGEQIFAAFEQRIAAPIGMQDYQPSDGAYFRGSASDHPAYPIRMSARDLARFALLYLHDGRWKDRQIVPAGWVHDSTQSYSDAFLELGPGMGYGYLWWIGFPTDMGAPTVRLPPRSFFALGFEGQFAFVIPAYDLVIIHRINSDQPHRPQPSFRQIARLLWLILSAAGDHDVGPDITLAHASGTRLDADALKTAVAGKTLALGGTRAGGPFAWQIRDDGTVSVLAGTAQLELAKNTWRIDDHGRYCRVLTAAGRGREECFDVVENGRELSSSMVMG
ncbi:MAG TPA: serine hydrolase [Bradyrhizobium sp.]|nr:serine hydrolase [Bradyrhizobium sp.]